MKLQILANSLRNVYPDLWEASCLTLQSRSIPADDPILKLVCKMMYVDHCLINTRRLEFTAHMLYEWRTTNRHKGLRKCIGYGLEAGTQARGEYHCFHIVSLT